MTPVAGVKRDRLTRSPVVILGVPVSTLSLGDTVGRVVDWAVSPEPTGGPRMVYATTVHGLMEGWRDPTFRSILARAGIVTADGMPLVWLGKIGSAGMEQVCGPTLMLRVCEASATLPVRHFFYGGAPGIAERLAAALSKRFPGLRVAGCYCPPFRPLTETEKEAVSARINAAGSDIVWVGLGTPKQERWAAEMGPRLAAKVIVTVGAAFDFHTGRIKRAPALLQRAGLEWAFRLWQEPRRLWRRYAYNNPLFVALALLHLTGLTSFSDSTISVERSDES